MKIMNNICFTLLFITFVSCSSQKNKQIPDTESLGIIPAPSSISIVNESFTLNDATEIYCQDTTKELTQLIAWFSGEIETTFRLKLKTNANASSDKKNTILFALVDSFSNKEGYSISVNKKQVIVKAKNPQGLFYGVQTILQLLYPQQNPSAEISIPGVEIEDEPLFSWRGLHMDVSRHFFSVDFVKKMIDVMAMHKMNTFHWHLTDDQGWRIEIKKYPKLTGVGAWRNKTVIGSMADQPPKYDNVKYGGFYTQEEIRLVLKKHLVPRI